MMPIIRSTILITFVAALSACGGGGSPSADSGGIGGTGVTSTGVMTKGSVILNGVRFDDTDAEVSIDDNTSKTKDDLKDGMVVQVLGRVGADNIATGGEAQIIEAHIEVRGEVTSVHPAESPQRFVVLGQNVLVDDLTIYSDISDFGDLTPNDLVEVHGLRDSSGRIRATRIEANTLQMGNSLVDEIRGVVSAGAGINPATFNLGTQPVNAAGAVIAPVGAMYQNDSLVEAHCDTRPCVVAGVFQASRIEVEDEEDAVFSPPNNGRLEVEGLISGYAPGDTDFFVAGIPVTVTGSTRYEGGIEDDLINDIKIEAEGTWSGSALIANKIEFKRAVVRLQGAPSAPSGNSFTLQIATVGAVTVEADDFTDLKDGTLPTGTESCVQVRGQRKAVAGQVVTAGEIRLSCSSSDRPLVQAPVEAEAGTILTLLGFAVDVSAPTDGYRDINDALISQAQFLSIVSPPTVNAAGLTVSGTLVKLTFDEITNLLREAEIED